jgi:Ca-activated chloride channel homolog
MKSSRFLIAFIVGILFLSSAFAQSGRRPVYAPNSDSANKSGPTPGTPNSGVCPKVLFPGEYSDGGLSAKTSPIANVSSSKDPDAEEVLKIDTTLVTIPVTVLDRSGKFIPGLTKCDFHIYEDGAMQEVTEFSAVESPFHVVLLLDTSNSTRFKMEEIQMAAIAFVNQLRPQDKVMVVTFDSKIDPLAEFTSDRFVLREAIAKAKTGGGTKLYDAVDWVITQRLDNIQGRKAIVLFTDGVDTSSRKTARGNLELVEESEVLVYPIQYDTSDGMQNGPYGRPGNSPFPDIWGNPNRYPRGRRFPLVNHWVPQIQIGRGQSAQDYKDAGAYLEDLAIRSGGRHQNADSMANVNRAFSMIAEELRHQYSLGYYPTNTAQDGTFRKVKVKASEVGWVLRAKEGYRAPSSNLPNSTQPGGRPILKRRTP